MVDPIDPLSNGMDAARYNRALDAINPEGGFRLSDWGTQITKNNPLKVSKELAKKYAVDNRVRPQIMVFDKEGNKVPFQKGLLATINMDELSAGPGYQGETLGSLFTSKAAGVDLIDSEGTMNFTKEDINRIADQELAEYKRNYPDQTIDPVEFRANLKAYAIANYIVQPWDTGRASDESVQGGIEEEEIPGILSTMSTSERNRTLSAIQEIINENPEKTYTPFFFKAIGGAVEGTGHLLENVNLIGQKWLGGDDPDVGRTAIEDIGIGSADIASQMLSEKRKTGFNLEGEDGTSVLKQMTAIADEKVATPIFSVAEFMYGGVGAGRLFSKGARMLGNASKSSTIAKGTAAGARIRDKIAAGHAVRSVDKLSKTGHTLGSLGYWSSIEGIPLQQDLLEMGMDPDTARWVSMSGGLGIALIEQLQVGSLAKGLKANPVKELGKSGYIDSLKETIKHNRKNWFKRRWANVVDIARKVPANAAEQIAEEMVQSALRESIKMGSGWASNTFGDGDINYNKTWTQVKDEFLEELTSVSIAMTGLTTGRSAWKRAQRGLQNRKALREFERKKAERRHVGAIHAEAVADEAEALLESQAYLEADEAAAMLGLEPQELEFFRSEGLIEYETNKSIEVAEEFIKSAKEKLADADNPFEEAAAQMELDTATEMLNESSFTYERSAILDFAEREGRDIDPAFAVDTGHLEAYMQWLENPNIDRQSMALLFNYKDENDIGSELLLPNGQRLTLPVSKMFDILQSNTARREFLAILTSGSYPHLQEMYRERLLTASKTYADKALEDRIQPLVDVFKKHLAPGALYSPEDNVYDEDARDAYELAEQLSAFLLDGSSSRSAFQKTVLGPKAFNPDGSIDFSTSRGRLMADLLDVMDESLQRVYDGFIPTEDGESMPIEQTPYSAYMPALDLLRMDESNFRGWVLANGGSDGMISTLSREAIINRLAPELDTNIVRRKWLIPDNLEKLGLTNQAERAHFMAMLEEALYDHTIESTLNTIKGMVHETIPAYAAEAEHSNFLDSTAKALIDLETRMGQAKSSQERMAIDNEIKRLFESFDTNKNPFPWWNYMAIKMDLGEAIPDYLHKQMERMYLDAKFRGVAVPDYIAAQLDPEYKGPRQPVPVKRMPITEAWMERVIDRVQEFLDTAEGRNLTMEQEDALYEDMYNARRGVDPDSVLASQERLLDYATKIDQGATLEPTNLRPSVNTEVEVNRARRLGETFKRLLREGILEDPDVWNERMLSYLDLTPQQVETAVMLYRQRVNLGEPVSENMISEVMYQAVTGRGIDLEAETLSPVDDLLPEHDDYTDFDRATARQIRAESIDAAEAFDINTHIEENYDGRQASELSSQERAEIGELLDSYMQAIQDELKERKLDAKYEKEISPKKKKSKEEKENLRFLKKMSQLYKKLASDETKKFNSITTDFGKERSQDEDGKKKLEEGNFIVPHKGRKIPTIGISFMGKRYDVAHLEDGYDLTADGAVIEPSGEMQSPQKIKTFFVEHGEAGDLIPMDLYRVGDGKDTGYVVVNRETSKISSRLNAGEKTPFNEVIAEATERVIFDRKTNRVFGASKTIIPELNREGFTDPDIHRAYKKVRSRFPSVLRSEIDSWVRYNTDNDAIRLAMIKHLERFLPEGEVAAQTPKGPGSVTFDHMDGKGTNDDFLVGHEPQFKKYHIQRMDKKRDPARRKWEVFYDGMLIPGVTAGNIESARSIIYDHWMSGGMRDFVSHGTLRSEMGNMLQEGSSFLKGYENLFEWKEQKTTSRVRKDSPKEVDKLVPAGRMEGTKLAIKPSEELIRQKNGEPAPDVPATKEEIESSDDNQKDWAKLPKPLKNESVELAMEIAIAQLQATGLLGSKLDVVRSQVTKSTDDGGEGVITYKDKSGKVSYALVHKSFLAEHGTDSFLIEQVNQDAVSESNGFVLWSAALDTPSDWFEQVDVESINEGNYEEIHRSIIENLIEEGYEDHISESVKDYYGGDLFEGYQLVNDFSVLPEMVHIDNLTAHDTEIALENISSYLMGLAEAGQIKPDISRTEFKNMIVEPLEATLEDIAGSQGIPTQELMEDSPQLEKNIIALYRKNVVRLLDHFRKMPTAEQQAETERLQDPVEQQMDAELRQVIEYDRNYGRATNHFRHDGVLYVRVKKNKTEFSRDNYIPAKYILDWNNITQKRTIYNGDVDYYVPGMKKSPKSDQPGPFQLMHAVMKKGKEVDHPSELVWTRIQGQRESLVEAEIFASEKLGISWIGSYGNMEEFNQFYENLSEDAQKLIIQKMTNLLNQARKSHNPTLLDNPETGTRSELIKLMDDLRTAAGVESHWGLPNRDKVAQIREQVKNLNTYLDSMLEIVVSETRRFEEQADQETVEQEVVEERKPEVQHEIVFEETEEERRDEPGEQQTLFSISSPSVIVDEFGNQLDMSNYVTEESQLEGEQYSVVNWTNLPNSERNIDPKAILDIIPGLEYIGYSEALGAHEYRLGKESPAHQKYGDNPYGAPSNMEVGKDIISPSRSFYSNKGTIDGDTIWIKYTKFIPYQTGEITGYGQDAEYDAAREATGVSATGGAFLNFAQQGGDNVILISDLGMDMSPGGAKTLTHEFAHMLQFAGRISEDMQVFILQEAVNQGRVDYNAPWDVMVEATADMLTEEFMKDYNERNRSGLIRKFRNILRRFGRKINTWLINAGMKEMNIDYIVDRWTSGKFASERQARRQNYLNMMRTIPSRMPRNFYDILGNSGASAADAVAKANDQRRDGFIAKLISSGFFDVKQFAVTAGLMDGHIKWAKATKSLITKMFRAHDLDDKEARNMFTRLTEEHRGFMAGQDRRLRLNMDRLRSLRDRIFGSGEVPDSVTQMFRKALSDQNARLKLPDLLTKKIKDPKERERLKGLFQEYGEVLQNAREHIDELSRLILQVVPDIDEELALRIDKNLDVYVTRSYNLFTSEDYIDYLNNTEAGKELYKEAALKIIETHNERLAAKVQTKAFYETLYDPDSDLSKDYRQFRKDTRADIKEGLHADIVSELGSEKAALARLSGMWKMEWAQHSDNTGLWEADYNEAKMDEQQGLDETVRMLNRLIRKGGRSGVGEGKLNTQILMKRKEIDIIFRKLYGEITDADQSYGISVTKMAKLIANAQFHNELLKNPVFGSGMSLNSEPGKFDKTFQGTEWGVLASSGYFFTEELYDAIEGAFGKTFLGQMRDNSDFMSKILVYTGMMSQINKATLTIFNPKTAGRNPVEAMITAMFNGHFSMGNALKGFIMSWMANDSYKPSKIRMLVNPGIHLVKEAMHFYDMVQDSNGLMNLVFQPGKRVKYGKAKAKWHEETESFQDLVTNLTELGLLSNDKWSLEEENIRALTKETFNGESLFSSREAREKFRENPSVKSWWELQKSNWKEGAGRKVAEKQTKLSVNYWWKALTDNKTTRSLAAAYRIGDDVAKVMGYLTEKQHLERAMRHEGATEEEIRAKQEFIIQKAVNKTLDITTTYSRVPIGLKAIGSIPIIGSFAGWTASYVQSTIGRYANAMEEIQSDNKYIKNLGIKRVILALLGDVGLAALGRMIIPIFYDDDDEFEAYRSMLNDWQKGHTIIPFKFGNNSPEFFDATALIPSLMYGDIFFEGYNEFSDKGIIAGLGASFATATEPFLDTDVYTDRLVDVFWRTGKPEMAPQVWSVFDNPLEVTAKAVQHLTIGRDLRGPLIPGFVSEMRRAQEALSGEESRTGVIRSPFGVATRWMIGTEINRMEPEKKLTFKAMEFKRRYQEIKTELRRSGFSESSAKFKADMEDFRKENEVLYRDMAQVVYAARKMGMSLSKIEATLRQWNMGAEDIKAFINKSSRKPVFSPKIVEGILDASKTSKDRNRKRTILRRYTDDGR